MTILFLGGVTEISTCSPQAISAPPTAAQSSLAFYAALSNKAGPVLGDTITNDISIKALATDVGGLVTQLTITVDSATPVVLNAPFGANATFNLPSQSLAFYAGGSLADGQHTVSLVVQDDQGNTASSTVTAILRRATPTLTGALANDTGIPGDGITSDDSITGTATNAGGLYALTGALDNGAVIQDFTSTIGAGGTYTISAARMGQFTGGTLPDGAHTLTLKAVDIGGTVTAQTISFTLRTSTPAVASFVTAAGQSSAAMANNTPVVLSMTDIIANAALRMGIDFASPIVPASAPAPSVEPIVMSDGSLMADQTGMLLAGVGSRQTHTLV